MSNEIRLPKPLFQDPVFGAPTDPVIVRNEEEEMWYLFFTQRRATDIYVGASWVHGTKIGVAVSRDGAKWLYRGALEGLDFEPGMNTFWAPEIVRIDGIYHMFVSYVQGVPVDWEYPRKILHYTSADLWHWDFRGPVDLESERVIDACLYEVRPNRWKMWFKDENNHSYTTAAESSDLEQWTVLGPEITDCAQEGPNVFEFGGKKWLISDYWSGLAVYSSEDFIHWERRADILGDHGEVESDYGMGHHADVLVRGDRAYIVYFCTPMIDKVFAEKLSALDKNDPAYDRKRRELFESVPGSILNRANVQIAELHIDGDDLILDRNAAVYWEA